MYQASPPTPAISARKPIQPPISGMRLSADSATSATRSAAIVQPGVTDASRDRNRLLITATDAEGVVRRLLATDPELRRLDVREAGLADAYNELTREAA